MSVEVLVGDCVAEMAKLPANSIDAIVTDPPYGLEFMGKAWDRLDGIGATSHAGPTAPNDKNPYTRSRVSYSGSSNRKCRTCDKWQWSAVKCECEVPDFPSVNAHQAQLMEEWHTAWAKEALRVLKPGGYLLSFGGTRTYHRMTCAIEDAGFEIRDCLMWLYGSGFPKSHDVSKAIDKQAGAERKIIRPRTYEVMVDGVYGKSLNTTKQRSATCEISEPATTQAQQWEGWGTALKPAYEPIVLARKPLQGTVANNVVLHGTGALNINASRIGTEARTYQGGTKLMGDRPWNAAQEVGQRQRPTFAVEGRWPANVLLDEEAGAILDEQSGTSSSKVTRSGGASRFFYSAKASKKDRGVGNNHPTVKPTELMKYLIKLVTPPGGTVLDPFGGSGSTGVAALRAGFDCVLIEREEEYAEIIRKRLEEETKKLVQDPL